MTVVVDVGCYHHPDHQGKSQDSVSVLLDRYQPERLYGFDPQLPKVRAFHQGHAMVSLYPVAAWTYDGTVVFDSSSEHPLSASVGVGLERVPCVDIADWLDGPHLAGQLIVLKIDAEGAEYALLEHLLDSPAIERVTELLVEWHPIEGGYERKAKILERLTCPVEDWSL